MVIETEEAPRQRSLPTTNLNNNGSLPDGKCKPDALAGFTKLPNAVALDSSLSMGSRFLYAVLVHHQGVNAESWPSQKLLVAELGASERTVRRYLRELEKAGLVKTRQVGLHRTNRYTVLNPQPVKTDNVAQECAAKPVDTQPVTVTDPRVRRTNQEQGARSAPLLACPDVFPPLSKESVVKPSVQARENHTVGKVESDSGTSSPVATEQQESGQQAADSQQVAAVATAAPLGSSNFSIVNELELALLLGSSLAALYSTTHEKDSDLAGVEPARSVQSRPESGEQMTDMVEGVVTGLRPDPQVAGRYRLDLADGREFGVPNGKALAIVFNILNCHVRFPVRANGDVAKRPELVDRTAEGRVPKRETGAHRKARGVDRRRAPAVGTAGQAESR